MNFATSLVGMGAIDFTNTIGLVTAAGGEDFLTCFWEASLGASVSGPGGSLSISNT